MGAAAAAINGRRGRGNWSASIPDEVKEVGWVAVPHSACKKVPRALRGDYIALVCLMNIIDETIGGREVAGERPEWARIRRQQFAYWSGGTVDGVDKALTKLEDLGFIESRLVGRNREYRAVIQALESAEPKPERKLPRNSKEARLSRAEAEDEQDEEVSEAEVTEPDKKAALRIVKPTEILVLFPGDKRPVPLVDVCPKAAQCELAKKYSAVANNGLSKETVVLQYDHWEPWNAETLVLEYDYPQFRAYLEHRYTARLQERPSDEQLRPIFDELAAAGVRMQKFVTRLDLRDRSMGSWVFLNLLAQDCISAAKSTASRNGIHRAPEAPDRTKDLLSYLNKTARALKEKGYSRVAETLEHYTTDPGQMMTDVSKLFFNLELQDLEVCRAAEDSLTADQRKSLEQKSRELLKGHDVHRLASDQADELRAKFRERELRQMLGLPSIAEGATEVFSR